MTCRVFAQPPKPPVAAPVDDYTAANELGKQLKNAEPQVAIDAWSKFFESRPKLTPGIAINVSVNIADLYGDKLNNTDKVLEIADWAVKKYNDQPEVAFILWRKTKTLLALKRYDELVKVADDNKNEIERGGTSGANWLAMYAACCLRDINDGYEAKEQDDKAIALILNAFNTMPALLEDTVQGFGGWRRGWMYVSLIPKLIKAGRTDEALRWAKMHYVAAAFDKEALGRATVSLGKVWGEAEEYQKIRVFSNLQEEGADATIKNPIIDVKLPELDAKPLAEHLARTQLLPKGALDRDKTKEFITLHIATGDFGGAMTAARRLMKDDPTNANGPLEICRVFKAADSSTRRANQYLMFLDGKAENPMPDFLKEYAPKPAAP